MNDAGWGIVLLIIAGVMNASFALPMKFTRKWAWENTWLAWSICALLFLPPLLAVLTIPHLGDVYQQAGSSIIIAVVLFGAGWGIAQVLFGLALDIIGIALTFSIVLGLSAAMGSLIPLVRLHRDQVFTRPGITALIGIGLVVLGVAICAVAGRMRERSQTTTPRSDVSFARGLTIAIASGICASMMNFGVAFGGPLIAASRAAGAQPYWTVNSIWMPLMAGGAVPNILYCIYLLRKNATTQRFSQAGTASHWLLALVMAAFWFGSSLLYGAASGQLGSLGVVLGWPLFMSLIVIVATVIGVVTGEWKSAGAKALQVQMVAVAILVGAVVVLSRASF